MTMMKKTSCIDGCKCLSGCYNGTTTAKDLNCSPGRIQRPRFRSSALAATAKLNCLEATAHSGLPQTLAKVAHWIIVSNFALHILGCHRKAMAALFGAISGSDNVMFSCLRSLPLFKIQLAKDLNAGEIMTMMAFVNCTLLFQNRGT